MKVQATSSIKSSDLDLKIEEIGESGVSCNNCYSNPFNVKSVEYLRLIFISLGSPLVALEREIFKLTKGYMMSEKIEPK